MADLTVVAEEAEEEVGVTQVSLPQALLIYLNPYKAAVGLYKEVVLMSKGMR